MKAISFTLFAFLISASCLSQKKEFRTDYRTYTPVINKSCFSRQKKLETVDDDGFPKAVLKKGKFTVFDYVQEVGPEYNIYNSGDTSETADSYFFQRVTFQVKPVKKMFLIRGSDIKHTNGIYVFYGAQKGFFITDFKIRTGYIKGQEIGKNEWLIEASVGVEGKGDGTSTVREISFKKTFKNCN